eukprot:403350762
MNSTKQVIDVASRKFLVTGGPALWVSKLLHQRGCLSANKIWEEFQKDPLVDKNLIKSKSYLKERILDLMETQGKIEVGRAVDIPQFKHSGYQLIQHRAFRNVAPEILAQIEPLPVVNRQDYKDFLRNNNIPYDF